MEVMVLAMKLVLIVVVVVARHLEVVLVEHRIMCKIVLALAQPFMGVQVVLLPIHSIVEDMGEVVMAL